MLQLIIAILAIIWFLSRLIWQWRRRKISKNEFIFWLFFWLLVLVLVLFLKTLDKFVASLGFSSSAIQTLSYLAIAALFYFIFRLRLKLEKIEENITKLTESLAKRERS